MKTMQMKPNKMLLISFISALFGLALLVGNASAKLTVEANHDVVSVNSFYHGSSVSVKGECDPGTDLIIKITAPEHETVLKEKGKAGGILWMNVGELHFDNTPNLYFLRSSKKVEDLIGAAEADKYILGLPALKRHIKIEEVGDDAEKAQWFSELVKYKEQYKLYSEGSDQITFADKDGKHTYYTLFDWPYQAQPGNYKVDVYAVKDGKVVDTADSKVIVQQVGAVKYLTAMAKNNGAMYGIVSIIVALVSGFGAGIIFKGGGGSH